MVMPGARVVSTVTAIDAPTAVRPIAIRPCAPMKRSTMSASPPRPPPLLARAMMLKIRPPAHIQKPDAASRGNAIARAPSCIGTTAMHRPTANGNSVPNTRPTRWASRSCGVAASSMFAMPARSRLMMTLTTMVPSRPMRPAPRNSRPIFLWSVDVSQSAMAASNCATAPSRSSANSSAVAVVGSMVVIRNGAHNFRFNGSNRLEVAAHNGPRLLAEG